MLGDLVALGGDLRARRRRAAGGSRRSAGRRGRAASTRAGPGRSTSTRSASAKRRRALRIARPGQVAGRRVAAEDHEAVVARDADPPKARSLTSTSSTSSRRGALHVPSIAAVASPAPDLDEYRRGAEELLAAPGPAADERAAGLFTAEAAAGLRAQGAGGPRPLRRRGAAAAGQRGRDGRDPGPARRARRGGAGGPPGARRRWTPPWPPSPTGSGGARSRPGGSARSRTASAPSSPRPGSAASRRPSRPERPPPRSCSPAPRGSTWRAVAAHGAALLDATDDAAGRALARAAQDALGDGGAEAADLPRIVRAPQLGAEVSSPRAGDVASRTLELLELQLPAGPPAPSGGREGLALWLETLGALGAALAAARRLAAPPVRDAAAWPTRRSPGPRACSSRAWGPTRPGSSAPPGWPTPTRPRGRRRPPGCSPPARPPPGPSHWPGRASRG